MRTVDSIAEERRIDSNPEIQGGDDSECQEEGLETHSVVKKAYLDGWKAKTGTIPRSRHWSQRGCLQEGHWKADPNTQR